MCLPIKGGGSGQIFGDSVAVLQEPRQVQAGDRCAGGGAARFNVGEGVGPFKVRVVAAQFVAPEQCARCRVLGVAQLAEPAMEHGGLLEVT